MAQKVGKERPEPVLGRRCYRYLLSLPFARENKG